MATRRSGETEKEYMARVGLQKISFILPIWMVVWFDHEASVADQSRTVRLIAALNEHIERNP